MHFNKFHWLPLALIAGGLLTRFLFIWWPNEVVFDEVHTGKVVASYFTGRFDFFDVHPPLGKLLIAAALKLRGFEPGFAFATNGQPYDSSVPYVAFRFLPNLFGALIPVGVWWFTRELNFSRLSAFAAGALLVLDNALLVHSHFAMLDPFMLFFGVTALAAFLRGRKKNYDFKWLSLAGLLFGLAVSSKWTALAFAAPAMILAGWDMLEHLLYLVRTPPTSSGKDRNNRAGSFVTVAKLTTGIIFLPLVVYIAVFAVHFKLITRDGQGSAFLPPDFNTRSFYSKFTELNKIILTVNANNLAPHPYSSRPYTWPLMLRTVYYWYKGDGNTVAMIYLLGNPVVWWLSTLFGFLAVIFWHPRDNPAKKWLPVCLWLAAMLPLLLVRRTLFLYHYFTALIAAVMLLAGWLGDNSGRFPKAKILYAVMIIAATLFAYFAPLTYGLPLKPAKAEAMFWLKSWR